MTVIDICIAKGAAEWAAAVSVDEQEFFIV
jgi:hypothetical protein